ncbi:uncharacterized protein CLUP02_00969 [Colletotrichum lupini]|uniref:Uncharacterized protein n=1 Tax=Colletotrichum lupini TaxID=145971 RepID=A0A9Q8SCC7_9PEZI|nr:uncharacterized protein CLUP02_00969 [Colletotrichum lupini]UQC74321.1 hypothetical protein CLUP02_00969 [Colletotrichum lupini]
MRKKERSWAADVETFISSRDKKPSTFYIYKHIYCLYAIIQSHALVTGIAEDCLAKYREYRSSRTSCYVSSHNPRGSSSIHRADVPTYLGGNRKSITPDRDPPKACVHYLRNGTLSECITARFCLLRQGVSNFHSNYCTTFVFHLDSATPNHRMLQHNNFSLPHSVYGQAPASMRHSLLNIIFFCDTRATCSRHPLRDDHRPEINP